MDEELHYVSVTFKTNGVSTNEKPNDLAIIYEEVNAAGEQAWDTNPVLPENTKKAPLLTLLHVVAASLGVICVILVSVIIVLCIHFNTAMSEQHRDNNNLTTQNLQLQAEKADLERHTEELSREKDKLNRTIGVIMRHENFSVKTCCPQEVCKSCLDGWVLFQLKCYLFNESNYTKQLRTWEESRDECGKMEADLVVIESKEEQEFINNHTKSYHDDKHGYWIGLRKQGAMDSWMWADGSNVTVAYWRTQEPGYSISCALTLPHADPLANWNKAGCGMKNRWICETSALFK